MIQNHIIYNLRNTPLRHYPYTHFFCENVFPASFYEDLLDSLPTDSQYKSGPRDYHGRRFGNPSSISLVDFMNSREFMLNVAQIFLPQLKSRFPDGQVAIRHDLRLVRDQQAYEIGPHTDASWKLVSLLFYLPENNDLQDLGTSIFTPKDPSFYCPGGPHHPFDQFNKVYTAPFIPNSCFGFFRTNTSFHGVSPITIPCERNVLLYNLYDATPPANPAKG